MKRSASAIALCVVLSGCTLATGPSQFGGLTPVNLEVPEGGDVRVLAAVYPIDFDLEPAVRIGHDIVGTRVGNDYQCLVVNQSWFAVNKLPIPGENGEGSQIKPEWVYAAPETSELSEGATPGSPYKARDIDAAGGSDAPVRIDSALLPYRTANNLGTESQWVVTDPQTCVEVPLYLEDSAPLSLVDFLLGPEGQRALAEAGIAYPVQGDVPDEVALLAPEPVLEEAAQSEDAQSAEPQRSGSQSSGSQSAEPQRSGPQSSGSQSSGSQSSGSQNEG